MTDMLEDIDEELLPFISDYKINLLEPKSIMDFTKFRTQLKQLFEVLQNASDKNRLQAVLQEDEQFKNMDRETVEAINLFAGMNIQTDGKEEVIEQITKNLNKLIEVVKLVDLSESPHVERELMLIKIKASGAQRAEVKRTADIFRGQIVDVTPSIYTVQLTGTTDKLDSFIQAVGTASIVEVVRSGVTGIARGDKVLSL